MAVQAVIARLLDRLRFEWEWFRAGRSVKGANPDAREHRATIQGVVDRAEKAEADLAAAQERLENTEFIAEKAKCELAEAQDREKELREAAEALSALLLSCAARSSDSSTR